jgi:transposase
MKFDQTNITENIAKARELLNNPQHCSAEFSVVFLLILSIFELMLPRLFKNSKNSSIPPSQDQNRNKNKDDKSSKKPGGQPGRQGKNLAPFAKPDEIIEIKINRKTLPKGHIYTHVGVAKRQVVDVIISRHVKEYQLEILQDENGKIYTAEAPNGASRPVQYGSSVKAMAVYLNMFQMLPYARLEDYFSAQADIPVSAGSLCNFNQEAFDLLANFEEKAKNSLVLADILHSDETSININGKKHWLHNASNDLWTLLLPHEKRGTAAMDAMDILPLFKGVMVHDHWKPYFTYKNCVHALCNAHHLRELQAAIEAAPQNTWAAKMKELLLEINAKKIKENGVLLKMQIEVYKTKYLEILKIGDKECPPPTWSDVAKKRGKLKKTKERNLLERLRNFQKETLRFMTRKDVPFTNNQGERDIRMIKVQQKISGCFKTLDRAKIACRIRSYLLTCQKNGVAATDAMNLLFNGKLPDFCG